MPPVHTRCSRFEAFYSHRGINLFSEIKNEASNSCSGASASVGDQAGPQCQATVISHRHTAHAAVEEVEMSPACASVPAHRMLPPPCSGNVLCSSPRIILSFTRERCSRIPCYCFLSWLNPLAAAGSGHGCFWAGTWNSSQRSNHCLDTTSSARKLLPVSSGVSPRATLVSPRYGTRPTPTLPRPRHVPLQRGQQSYILISATT